jgi:hypothetical protein
VTQRHPDIVDEVNSSINGACQSHAQVQISDVGLDGHVAVVRSLRHSDSGGVSQPDSPARSSRARSPAAMRRLGAAGSSRLISRAIDGAGTGERHRRRRRPGGHRWRPLRRCDLHSRDGQRRHDAVKQALRQIGVDLEVSTDTNIGGGREKWLPPQAAASTAGAANRHCVDYRRPLVLSAGD